MTQNAFIGRKTQPTDHDVAEALGPAKPVPRLMWGTPVGIVFWQMRACCWRLLNAS
jgi:hypothetical protein